LPEGDTVHKLARALRPLLEGEALAGLWLRDRGEVPALRGLRVEEVAALGKHFLFGFGSAVVLHVHLGLHGRWHRYRPEEPARRAGEPSLRLSTRAWSLLCFHAKHAELVRRRELSAHPQLARLGPDLLADDVDFDEIRLRARRRDPRSLGDLLLDQAVAAGIGNAFRNEILFLAGLRAERSPRSLDDQRLIGLFRCGRELLQRNLGGWPRTTTRPVRPGEPWPPGLPRLFVFERTGEACLRCGAAIEHFRQGAFASPTYRCPRCQPETA
jgi:endonuclease VIII